MSQVVYIIVSARKYGGLTVHIPIGACRWLESLELLRLGISVRGDIQIPYNTTQYSTLCFKNPGHLPGFKAALGSRRMIPSPPLSTTS